MAEPALRLKIVRKLGERPYGEALLARRHEGDDEALTELLVIKADLAIDPLAIQRLLADARVARSLVLPQLGRVYGTGRLSGERTFIAVQHFPAGSWLRDVVLEQGAVDEDDVLRLGAMLCEALASAHAAKLIHGNLSAACVWLEGNLATGRPCLMHFGLSRVRLPGTVALSHGSYFAVPEVAAPEGIAGKAVDPRADLYALGVLLLELRTGERQTAGGIVDLRGASSGELAERLGERLGPVIERLIAYDPAARFASAAETLAALRKPSRPPPVRHVERLSDEIVALPGPSRPPRPVSAPPPLEGSAPPAKPAGIVPILAHLPSPTPTRTRPAPLAAVEPPRPPDAPAATSPAPGPRPLRLPEEATPRVDVTPAPPAPPPSRHPPRRGLRAVASALGWTLLAALALLAASALTRSPSVPARAPLTQATTPLPPLAPPPPPPAPIRIVAKPPQAVVAEAPPEKPAPPRRAKPPRKHAPATPAPK
jgi:serine/threonine protein kinase